MKGIIFVVWEKYLTDRFGTDFIDTYRENIDEPIDQLPVSGRTYPDTLLPEIYKHQQKPTTVHVSQIYTVLAKLVQVGLVASTVNQQGDTFASRRYWRAPTHD